MLKRFITLKISRQALGAYQIIGGLWSLCTLWSAMWARGVASLAGLILVSTLAVLAGVTLSQGTPRGWRLTVVNQLVQLVGFQVAGFTVTVVHLAKVALAARWVVSANAGESSFDGRVAFGLGDSVCDLGPGLGGASAPTYGFTLNLLALGLLVWTLTLGRRSGEGPTPTVDAGSDSATLEPAADQ